MKSPDDFTDKPSRVHQPEADKIQRNGKNQKSELIEQFIENAPRITRSKTDFFDPDDYAKS
jgi:hypothetical protein